MDVKAFLVLVRAAEKIRTYKKVQYKEGMSLKSQRSGWFKALTEEGKRKALLQKAGYKLCVCPVWEAFSFLLFYRLF